MKTMDLDDILEIIEICRKTVAERLNGFENVYITEDMSVEEIVKQELKKWELVGVIKGVNIVKRSIEKIYKEEQL